MRAVRLAASILSGLLASGCHTLDTPAPAIDWQPFTADVFARAKPERRLVLLDLGTSWCHWCHVMAATTYADPGVCWLLARHFVSSEEDADVRLDLATRYQDYGWPATIVFDADGHELWKQRGYVEPERMRRVLQSLVDDPSPLPAVDDAPAPVAVGGGLSASTRRELESRMDALYDDELGGYRGVHKYLDGAAASWLLVKARAGDAASRRRLLQTLDAERALLDPVWGGAYQYSHGGNWSHPHFEKIMSRQLADLGSYSLAFGAFARDEDLAAARSVAGYVVTMLRSPEGAFFANQDADLVRGEHGGEYFALADAARRARGLPHIETSLWSRENGQAIQGLCALLAVAPDAELMATTVTAAQWICAHRRLADGAFTHGASDAAGPFLADSLEMAAALAALAELQHEPRWLSAAVQTLLAVDRRFGATQSGVGYATAVADGVLPAIVDRTENVWLARTANRVWRQTGNVQLRRIAESAFAYAALDRNALQPGLPADLLLAADELAHEPVHVVVVGRSDEAAAQELFATALRAAPAYRCVEFLAPGAETARGDTFPPVRSAAAFVCANGACSAPIPSSTELEERLR